MTILNKTILIIIILWTNYFYAQELPLNQQGISFEHITVSDGLPDNNIKTIIQDHFGFLWFGTWNGLVRYDGNEFKTYRPKSNDPRSLSSRIITCILEDKHGQLWVGTSNGLHVYQFDTEDFILIKISDNNPNGKQNEYIQTLFEDRHGNIWIGGFSGLDKFDPSTKKLTHYNYDLSDDLSSGYNRINSICEDNSGNIIVGTLKGLCKVDPKRLKYFPFLKEMRTQVPLSHESILSLFYDDVDNLWIGTLNGLVRYNFRSNKSKLFLYDSQSSHNVTGNTINAIYQDRHKTIWVATGLLGINKYDTDKDGFISYQNDSDNPNSISGNWVLSIYEDRSGILWFGCWADGINKYNPYKQKFIHIKREPNNPNTITSNKVLCIQKDSKGFVWIGTDEGGINRFNPKTGEFNIIKLNTQDPINTNSNYIACVYEDKMQRIWIGTRNGLYKLLPSEDRVASPIFKHYYHDPLDSTSISSNYIQTILEDSLGTLWIGTLGGGLNTLSKSEANKSKAQFYHYNYNSQDSNSFDYIRVVSIYEDRLGTIWIGTDGRGLKRYNRDSNNFKHFSDPRTGFDEISCIFEDSFDRMWIGTYTGGLHLFDRKTGLSEIFNDLHGLPNNAIKGILEDGEKNLWISTEKGLSRFNYRNKTFRNYSVSDGLQADKFYLNSACKSHDGLLYFGGANGFNIINPKNINDNPFPPQVVLTDLKIFNKSVTIGQDSPLKTSLTTAKEINLSYFQNDIIIEFAGLDFSFPSNNSYTYKLENYDKDWRQAEKQRNATYTNLDPGEYIFLVKAANSDGIWNETPASLKIIIVPPFWQTIWFKSLLVFIALSFAYTGYKIRIRQLENKRKLLEERVIERTEAAQKLKGALDEVKLLKNQLQAENVYLQDELKVVHNFENIISTSDEFNKVLRSVEQVASTDSTVLVLGETGTGKELLARAIHSISKRSDRPLVKINCATLPENLIESELFGHEKGAFTGAISRKVGRFELANNGTIFLDEIGELPLGLQTKLLRVIQEGEFERLGDIKTVKVDVRIIAATNRILEKEIKEGSFREDLYYRLNVFPIQIPPLRDRREDIPILVKHFLRKYNIKAGKKLEIVTQDVMEKLQGYTWPGNIRELENIIERAVVTSTGKKLTLGDWLTYSATSKTKSKMLPLEEMEKQYLIEVLEMTEWKVSGEKGAAKILDINPQTLVSRMKKLGVQKPK